MRKILSCLVLSLAAPLAAHAQSGCDLVNRLTSDAARGFSGVIGEQIIGDSYDTSVQMTGAAECGVVKKATPYYYCAWDAVSKEAALSDQYRLVRAITPCMAGWSWREMPLDHVTVNGKRVVGGNLYDGQGANAGLLISIYVLELSDGNGGGSGEFVRYLEVFGRT